MDTRQVATEYRLVQWAQMMQEKNSNGQNINNFCQSKGISKHKYFYWQRKLREAAITQLASQDHDSMKDIIPNGWARVVPAASHRTENALAIEVGGYRVMATIETETELLLKVCRALKSLC